MTEGIPNHFEVIRSLHHGHVMAILETIKKLGLDKIISEKSSRIRNLVVAMIVARIINPKSKLATARGFNSETCSQSLGQLLDVEIQPETLPDNGQSVGIDLGIATFATLSTGEKINAPKPLKKRLKRLKKAQRNLSRKQKGSKRREKARKRVAKIHAKIKDTRTDFLHKLSTRVVRENQTIVLEDLNTSGMVKNRKLSRAISDLGWRFFRDMLSAKSDKYGRNFRIISRWEPTSQRCSCCGNIGGKKALNRVC